jgi:hypothetical protein
VIGAEATGTDRRSFEAEDPDAQRSNQNSMHGVTESFNLCKTEASTKEVDSSAYIEG